MRFSIKIGVPTAICLISLIDINIISFFLKKGLGVG